MHYAFIHVVIDQSTSTCACIYIVLVRVSYRIFCLGGVKDNLEVIQGGSGCPPPEKVSSLRLSNLYTK